uniref:Cadherin-7 n=1 Tax=Felis catus TaxID=9685 RepID=A0ABI7XA66_FELCA
MKLGKVELCHFLQLIALFLCFSGMSQAELSRSRSKPYFQSGRSRTKRSWVWNQFFVLEEYMGSDPLYVGKAPGNTPQRTSGNTWQTRAVACRSLYTNAFSKMLRAKHLCKSSGWPLATALSLPGG